MSRGEFLNSSPWKLLLAHIRLLARIMGDVERGAGVTWILMVILIGKVQEREYERGQKYVGTQVE